MTDNLTPGSFFQLRASAVCKRISGVTARMFAFNGTIPGPTLRVVQGSEVIVHFTNDLNKSALVHWHGLRMSSLFDPTIQGNHRDTRLQVPAGGSFSYRLHFPDPGLYCYHHDPRDDCSPAHGLYGSIIVIPSEPDYWPLVNRELVLMFDELLVPYGNEPRSGSCGASDNARTGYERLMLLNGDLGCDLQVCRGEVVRVYLANVANSRVLRLHIPTAQIKLVGGDVGRVERQTLVDEIVLHPWQRAIIDVLFDQVGHSRFEQWTPNGVHMLGCVDIAGQAVHPRLDSSFAVLRESEGLRMERRALLADWQRPPDRILLLTDKGKRTELRSKADPHAASGEQETAAQPLVPPQGDRPWWIIDVSTGAVNEQIDWSFDVGHRIKIRLMHEPAQGAIQHPLHFHGQRFLVLARNGVRNDNLAWEDTLWLRAGEIVDILLEAANPGAWIVHSHRLACNEQNMRFTLRVR